LGAQRLARWGPRRPETANGSSFRRLRHRSETLTALLLARPLSSLTDEYHGERRCTGSRGRGAVGELALRGRGGCQLLDRRRRAVRAELDLEVCKAAAQRAQRRSGGGGASVPARSGFPTAALDSTGAYQHTKTQAVDRRLLRQEYRQLYTEAIGACARASLWPAAGWAGALSESVGTSNE
jgi:hypothetical protein